MPTVRPRWIVIHALAAGDNERAAGCHAKIRKHPDRCHVHDDIWIGRRQAAGVPLIKRPIRMPFATRVARLIDRGRGERDAHVRA